jgi:hypothetical protein
MMRDSPVHHGSCPGIVVADDLAAAVSLRDADPAIRRPHMSLFRS